MLSGRRPRAPRALQVAALTLIGACSSFTPTNDHSFTPPAEYRVWFAKTQACSGLEGDFDRIQWYVVDGTEFDCPGGKCVGRWNSDHSIFISQAWTANEMVVRHEMLHDLLGVPGHPDPPFGNPCPLTWATWKGADTTSTATPPLAGRAVGTGTPNID